MTSIQGDAGPSVVNRETATSQDVRALIEQSRFDEGATLASTLIEDAADPDERIELRYMHAVALRYADRLEEADRALSALEAEAPEYPRLHQERGHLERRRGNVARAMAAFEQATRLDPALVGSWRALAALYGATNRPADAAQAGEKVDQLCRLPPELLAATNFLNENRLAKAERICRDFLQRNRTHVAGMRLLAEVASRLKVYDDAGFLLETALELEPDNLAVRVDYLNLLIRRTRFEAAHEQAQLLLERDPGNLAFRTSMATTLVGLGRFDAGIALYREILDVTPERAQLHLMLGHALKTVGRFDEAIDSYRRAYTLKPDFGDAYWSLANTKTYRFSDDEMALMHRYEAADETGTDDRIHLCFAAGKAHEDAAEYDRAFEFYDRGNTLKQRQLRYRDAATQRQVDAQIEVCTPELFRNLGDVGCDAPDPIFIVGLPRAGSTLLEQILASHSMVDATMELHDILALAQRLRGRGSADDARYPAILGELEPGYFRRFGEQYLEQTRIYRAGAPRFIDKMPNNFLHIGLIRLILPNARIIDARRHPMACCFSGFKQLFGEGQEFSYGLEEIGSYYRAYVRLMDHWDRVLPGFVLRVMHEDVVADLEGQVRRILDFCGLPFEERCLRFHETERSIRTPSSEQVKRPIYREGTGQWRHFEAHLGPLRDALGPELLARYPAAD